MLHLMVDAQLNQAGQGVNLLTWQCVKARLYMSGDMIIIGDGIFTGWP